MAKTVRLKDSTGPGTNDTFAKEVLEFRRKTVRMKPFTKKERM